MERVGTLETVCRYPVKSMAGEEIEAAFVGFAGLMGDRAFAFRREPGPSGFPWLTGREQEDLILYRPRFVDQAAAGLPRDVEKCFGLASGVFAAYPEPAALAVSVTTPGGQSWAVDSAELRAELEQKSGQKVSLRFSDRSHWDCRPVSLFGNASATALGEELGMPMDRRRFRANFYADWIDGRPFREDELVGRTLQIGDRLQLAVLERDPRCKMITLDPETGSQDSAVLRHLTKTRVGTIGVYAAVLVEGVVRKGDAITVA
jgi:MOSC domain-containing protein